MPAITGVTGNAVVTGNFSALIINVTDWQLTINSDLYDNALFADSNTNTIPQYRGLYSVTGTIHGHMDSAVGVTASHFAVAAAASTALTLTASTGRTYSGPAFLDFEFSENRIQGLVSYTATFVSDGDWAFA